MLIKDIRGSKSGIHIKHVDNTWTHHDCAWYFYIKKSQLNLLKQNEYDRIEIGTNYIKVFCDIQYARTEVLRNLLARGCETFEGDLKLEERYKYDNDIEISTEQDVLYFDIETDDRIKKIEIGRDYILSWYAIDNKGREFFSELKELTPREEERVINEFYLLCKKYDIIAGWNIKKFDIPVFRERGKRYDLRFPNCGIYDLYQRAKHIYRVDSKIRSYSLENMAQIFLGEGKIKHDGTYKLWERKDGTLLKYNARDTDLTKRIDEKQKISEMMILQSSWCKSFPRKFSVYALIDSVIIQQSHKLKKPVPTNYKALISYDETKVDDAEFEKYLGAEVFDPEIGYHENVYVFDFTQLYPTIIQTFNIGFDTLTYEPENAIRCAGTSYVKRGFDDSIHPTYFKKEKSCVVETVHMIRKLRDEYKALKIKYIENGWTDRLEYQKVQSDEVIVKELSNSIYGIMGMQYGRYYNVDVAESITLTSRWMLNFTKDLFIKHGHECIYGDTDSVFIKSDIDIDVQNSIALFHKEVKAELQRNFNVDESFIKLGFDKHMTTFMLFAKKFYCGLMDNQEGKPVDKILTRGMEYHKRNTFKFAADKQRTLCEDILRKKIPISSVLEVIRGYKAEFDSKKFTQDELEMSVRINKASYTGNSVSAVLSKAIKEETGLNPDGTEVKYIIVRNRPSLRPIMAEKYEGKFSRDYYWYNATEPLLNKVLQLVDPGKSIDSNTLF